MARVLIVDDEEMDRVLEATILQQEGHELVFAEDGEAALKICRHEVVDLVITDLAMPTSSGLRLIRELRESHFDVPVIAISGWAKDQLDLAERYGANFTLFKPIEGEELLKTVKLALEKGKGRRTDDPWSRARWS